MMILLLPAQTTPIGVVCAGSRSIFIGAAISICGENSSCLQIIQLLFTLREKLVHGNEVSIRVKRLLRAFKLVDTYPGTSNDAMEGDTIEHVDKF